MTVSFCGHADYCGDKGVQLWLETCVETVIARGAKEFLFGGYGGFDEAAAAAVWEAKKRHPYIVSTLVLPYLDREMPTKRYDGTVYPPLEHVPFRFAISKRNEWMVREADVLIAYVLHGWGGAAATLRYAERKKKEILRYTPER